MARYIDADKLIAHLKDEIKGCEIPFGSRANGKGIAYGTTLGLKSAISFAETLSTADVVPKSEVVLASSDAVKMLIECHGYALTHDADIKKEVAREFIEAVDSMIELVSAMIGLDIIVFGGKYAELKKKYTEGNDE